VRRGLEAGGTSDVLLAEQRNPIGAESAGARGSAPAGDDGGGGGGLLGGSEQGMRRLEEQGYAERPDREHFQRTAMPVAAGPESSRVGGGGVGAQPEGARTP